MLRPADGREAPALPRIQRHRIFVAVALAPDLCESVAGVRNFLGPAADRFRWVQPQNLHLTLRFLGSITETQTARVAEAAREIAASVPPFSITLAQLGAFPSARSPRVLWVGVTGGADRLTGVAEALEAALRRRKFPAEPRPFTPHLTVARVRSEGYPPDLTGMLAGAAAFVAGTQVVDALAVMESMLRPQGPIYREVAREVFENAG
jgi:2'-5' RNA ligase